MDITDYLIENDLIKVKASEIKKELEKRKFSERVILKLLKEKKVEKRGKHLVIKLS